MFRIWGICVVERKIIQVDDSAPLISKKKKMQSLITLGVVLGIVAVVVTVVLLTTTTRIQKVGNYTIIGVEVGALTSSTEASGSVVLPTQVSIVSMETGYVGGLYVNVGDSVDESTILAKVEVPELEQDLVDVKKSIITQGINLEQTKLSLEYTLKEYNIDLLRLEKDISEAVEDVSKAEELKNLKSSRESDYDEALDTLETLYNQKEDILLSIEKEIKLGELEIRSQKAQISQYKTDRDRIKVNIEAVSLKSPISGNVMSIDEILYVPGSLVSESVELFTVANIDDVYIDLEVYEEYRTALKVGDIMEILISSQIIEAEIIQIGSIASLSSDSLAATIEVRAKPIGEVNLTSGATAVASIPLGTKENVLLLPRGSYLTTGNQKYVYRREGDRAYRTEVVYGSIDGSKVEILSGLKAGDEIIISSYQSFIDQNEIELK